MTGVYELIKQQQKQLAQSEPAWLIGRQLKDMARREPETEAALWEDLTAGALTLKGAAQAMQAEADRIRKEQKGACVCITPTAAEKVLRKYFGLPEASEAATCPTGERNGLLDIADLL